MVVLAVSDVVASGLIGAGEIGRGATPTPKDYAEPERSREEWSRPDG